MIFRKPAPTPEDLERPVSDALFYLLSFVTHKTYELCGKSIHGGRDMILDTINNHDMGEHIDEQRAKCLYEELSTFLGRQVEFIDGAIIIKDLNKAVETLNGLLGATKAAGDAIIGNVKSYNRAEFTTEEGKECVFAKPTLNERGSIFITYELTHGYQSSTTSALEFKFTPLQSGRVRIGVDTRGNLTVTDALKVLSDGRIDMAKTTRNGSDANLDEYRVGCVYMQSRDLVTIFPDAAKELSGKGRLPG